MNNELNAWDVLIGCIVCILYISGKLWLYYNHTKDTKPKNKRVIRRGNEWPE
jgi:hypothetical protein